MFGGEDFSVVVVASSVGGLIIRTNHTVKPERVGEGGGGVRGTWTYAQNGRAKNLNRTPCFKATKMKSKFLIILD